MAGSLIVLDRIRAEIAKAASVEHVADLRNKTRAIEVYSKHQKDCKHIERGAIIVRLRAERRIGQLLSKSVARGSKSKPGLHIPIGITRVESSHWQQIAKISDKEFETYLATRRPSTKGLVRLVIQQQRKRQRGPSTGGGIITGDMSVLWNELDDNSVDLFLTDPPFAEVDAYKNLAELAEAKLKDGGICAAYSSLFYLPDILSEMSKHLTYWWCLATICQGPHRAIWARKMQGSWHPIILFAKGKPKRDWMIDYLHGGGKEKHLHDWQQPESEAEYLISKLSDCGDLVVDPYLGSGTTVAVAKRLGRRWIGVEKNTATARGARKRIAG